VIVINNITFLGHTPRDSAVSDSKHIHDLFKLFNYEVCMENNLSDQGMVDFLTANREKLKTRSVDVLVVVIMSHGARNTVYGTNSQPLLINPTILSIFSDENCPSLKGKPKLYFFQACQGLLRTTGLNDGGTLVQNDTVPKASTDAVPDVLGDTVCKELMGTASEGFDEAVPEELADTGSTDLGCYMDDDIRDYPDILIGFASCTGYVAWKGPYGSWYIRALIYVLAHDSHKDHIVDIMTKVNRIVTELRTQHATRYIQQPQIRDALSYKLYLLPCP